MGLNVGNLPVKQVHVGSTPVKEVHVGSERIWTSKEVVQITLGASYQAQNQLRAALTARGLGYQTVEEIPFNIEFVGSGSAEEMFRDCSALTAGPDMNTGQVTSMRSMFSGCGALTTVSAMDTSSATNLGGLFASCSALTSVPDMDTAHVTNMGYTFNGCSSLTDGNVRLIGRHPNVVVGNMITGSGLTRLPFYDAAGNPI